MNRYLLCGGDAGDLQGFPEGQRKLLSAFCNGNQGVGAVSRPDLHAYSVERGAVKTAQLQMLFDPTKEPFDGPAAAINLSDNKGCQFELIGDKDQVVTRLQIDVTDPAKCVWRVFFADKEIELDGLIATQSLLHLEVSDRATFYHIKAGVRFEARNKEGTGFVASIQTGEVEIPSVHQVLTSWIHMDFVQRCSFVPFSLVQTGEDRNVASQIEQHVKLHGGQILLPTSSGK